MSHSGNPPSEDARPLSFRSLYSQGFAPVAACGITIHLAEPDRNADAVLEMARECHSDGTALTVFSELTLSGFSIEDLFLQDALLDSIGVALEKIITGSHRRAHEASLDTFRSVGFRLEPPYRDLGLSRRLERLPFVPGEAARLQQDCFKAYSIQVAGLAQRLRATKLERVVFGVFGGLDSNHALIVGARTLGQLGPPRSNILAFTMPGFATDDKSRNLAHQLMQALGTTSRELDIRPAQTRCRATLIIRSRGRSSDEQNRSQGGEPTTIFSPISG